MNDDKPSTAAMPVRLPDAATAGGLASTPSRTYPSRCPVCSQRLLPSGPPTPWLTLSRQSVGMAISPLARSGEPLRGDHDNTFVLFDDSEGDPPRQLTIVVREASSSMWEMRITADPPVAGAVLITVGVQNFGGRFTEDGTAAIRNIPAQVLTDSDAPDLEIALLPLTATPDQGQRP